MSKNTKMYDNETKGKDKEFPNAILVALCTEGDPDSEDFIKNLEENESLMEACELNPVARVIQSLAYPNPGTYIGSGKLVELSETASALDAEYIVFADDLSPTQLKNIVDGVDAAVLDRTSLIMEIFARRARTREAGLQVELANLQYMLPRLVGMRKSLDRQGGAGGSMSNKGSGEKQIELDRRHIERRIYELRRDLKEVEHNREIQRKARQKGNIPQVALVGYTNVGKSTLMNHLVGLSGGEADKKVLEKDMLFATLDTTVRRISTGDKKDFLLSDTVGFISNLPHDLVEAFHSTLEEACFADLLLIVSDVSADDCYEKLEITEKTLRLLGAEKIPKIYVMNKVDCIVPDESFTNITTFKPGTVIGGNRIFISAAKEEGLAELIDLIKKQVYGSNEILKVLIPYTEGSVMGQIQSNANVISEEYTEEGIIIVADCTEALAGAIKNNPKIKKFQD